MICINALPVRTRLIHYLILYLMTAGIAIIMAADDLSVKSADGSELGRISIRTIDGTPMISLTQWASLVEADLEWDFVLGVAEMRFMDHRLRFADGGRGAWIDGRMQSLPAAVRQQDSDFWVPMKVLDDLVDSLWEGELTWNAKANTLIRFTSGPVQVQDEVPGITDDSIVIVLDPGHGGTDNGCLHINGSTEKDTVLKLAQRVSEFLINRLGAHVILTRSGDSDVSIDERVGQANRAGADLFVSIHISAQEEMPGRSFSIFHLPEKAEMETESGLQLWESRSESVIALTREFTRRFAAGLAETAEVREYTIQPQHLACLRGLMMPAFCVELSWDSMFYGDIRITEDSGRNRAAEAIFDGIRQCLDTEQ